MHTLSTIAREERSTLRTLSENTLVAAEQSADRLRSWAAVMSIEHHGEPFIRFDDGEWGVHALSTSEKADPESGVAMERLPASSFILIEDVEFYGIDRVLSALDKLIPACDIQRDEAPLEFHARDVNGGFAVGTLAVPVRQQPRGLPAELAVEAVTADDDCGRSQPAEYAQGEALPMPAGPVPVHAIAVTSQVGSRGDTIAYLAAAELGWRYCRDSVVQDAAARDPLVEVDDVERATRHRGILDRVLQSLAATPVSPMDPTMVMSEPYLAALIPDGEVRAVVDETMRSLAGGGDVVIAGHGAAHVLRGRPGTLGVFLWAPADLRAARVANESMAADDAIQFVQDADSERRAYFKDVFDTDWLDASAYDLTINTAAMSPSAAADLIVAAVRSSQEA